VVDGQQGLCHVSWLNSFIIELAFVGQKVEDIVLQEHTIAFSDLLWHTELHGHRRDGYIALVKIDSDLISRNVVNKVLHGPAQAANNLHANIWIKLAIFQQQRLLVSAEGQILHVIVIERRLGLSILIVILIRNFDDGCLRGLLNIFINRNQVGDRAIIAGVIGCIDSLLHVVSYIFKFYYKNVVSFMNFLFHFKEFAHPSEMESLCMTRTLTTGGDAGVCHGFLRLR